MSSENKQVWYSLEVIAVAAAAEAIEHAFVEMDALGTEINHLRKRAGDMVTVSGFFDSPPDAAAMREQLALILPVYDLDQTAIESIESNTVEETDWLAEWKKHWRPTTIGKFIITPPWETADAPDKIVISIEPNMAFGTGTHETTQLCLQAIGDHYRPGQSVLDVGTGTGILAIAAAKLAVTDVSILACDTDKDSVKIARENSVLNGVAEIISFFDGTIDENTPVFDFVIANLTIDVIVPMLELLIAKTGDTLLLSGILAEQQDEISKALKEYEISNFKFEFSGEWISVLVTL